MTRSRTMFVVALIALFLGVLPLAGRAETPTFFPDGFNLDTTAYTLRVGGADRYATAGTLALVAGVNQGVGGGFPFNEPEPGSPDTSYGFAACPDTIAVAAGDTVADALAGSSVKDLGLFTVGDQTINTADAALLLTTSARAGATGLSERVTTTIDALTDAGCSFDALIFGGENAVPAGAADELDALAGQVVRIAGANRYDTAAEIAADVTDSAGLPTVTWYEGEDDTESLPSTVFLAEAMTGADALAVGPFSASENAPILLTDTAALPAETTDALTALAPDTVIILGGTGAVSEEVEASAADAAGGAEVRRIAGADRYETSVMIAQTLFGIFEPATTLTGSTVDPTTHSNQMFGIARSEGRGEAHAGFPDALASAFFLDTAAATLTPARLAPPVSHQEGGVAIGGAAVPKSAPLLLVTQALEPEPVADYLGSLYRSRDIKTADSPDDPNHGGFGFVFGSTGAITRAVEVEIADQLSGGTYGTEPADIDPSLDQSATFYTGMEFPGEYTSSDDGGVDAEGDTFSGDKVCVLRNGLTGAQFLRLVTDVGVPESITVDYQNEDTAWPEFESRFQCVSAAGVTGAAAAADGLSLSGHDTSAKPFDWSSADRKLTTPVPGAAPAAPLVGGNVWTDISDFPSSGGSRTGSYTWNGNADFVLRGTTYTDAAFTATIEFVRTDAGGDDRVTFSGTIEVRDGATFLFRVSVTGESATIQSPFRLAGRYSLGTSMGGFRATVTKNADDTDASLSDLVLDGLA